MATGRPGCGPRLSLTRPSLGPVTTCTVSPRGVPTHPTTPGFHDAHVILFSFLFFFEISLRVRRVTARLYWIKRAAFYTGRPQHSTHHSPHPVATCNGRALVTENVRRADGVGHDIGRDGALILVEYLHCLARLQCACRPTAAALAATDRCRCTRLGRRCHSRHLLPPASSRSTQYAATSARSSANTPQKSGSSFWNAATAARCLTCHAFFSRETLIQ